MRNMRNISWREMSVVSELSIFCHLIRGEAEGNASRNGNICAAIGQVGIANFTDP
jgi:hypothetical protein